MQRLRQAKQTESHQVDSKGDQESEEDDAEWYKQEVGVDPDPGRPFLLTMQIPSITVQICF